jgi:hypothetical protein
MLPADLKFALRFSSPHGSRCRSSCASVPNNRTPALSPLPPGSFFMLPSRHI